MSTYVYCPRRSNGALELVQALPAKRLRKFDGMTFRDGGRKINLAEGDIVVCWGSSVPEMDGVRVLNSMPAPLNKEKEVRLLNQKGIATPSIYTASDARTLREAGHKVLGRSAHHEGGHDLLFPTNRPDYFMLKENFKAEYRIHSFDGRSIRAGVKIARDGFSTVENEREWRADANLVHPWVRSYDGGWRIKYDGFQSTQRLRALAHKAVAALELKFGAVDIGETVDGDLKVLEVNRAPGIEGTSVTAYVRAINRWIEGGANDAGRVAEGDANPI